MTALALACGPDDPGSADSGAGSGSDTGEATSTGEQATEATEGADTSGGGPVDEDVPARGVQISLVEANAGVAVPIGAYGEWVGPEGRNAPLPKGRNTAIRVYVDIDEGVWVQRDIEARLTVYLPDDTTEVLSLVETISDDSSTTSLQSGFLFGVVAELMVPGARYQVELFEVGNEGNGLPEPAEPPRTPLEPDFIGTEAAELEMKIVMVPVDYSGPGCNAMVDTSDETLARYEDAMFQQNPVETIDIQWADPYVVNDLDLGDPNDFFELLNRAAQLRASAAPDPNVYYYVLFDNCGTCIGDGGGCLLGVAPGISDDSIGAASLRVSIGTQYLGGSEIGIGTFVHELGHNQGRQHVACPGGTAAGPDPSYPHVGGSIGVWGFGVRDFQIRNASTHSDYMSYCDPTWVSDWQWDATYDRIRTLTSWDAADMSMPEDQAILVGMIDPATGRASWWTDRGFIPDTIERAAGHELRFMVGDEVLEAAEVQVEAWTEGAGFTVIAPLPADYDADVTAIEYRAPEHHYAAPRAAVTSYHRPDALTRP